MLFEMLTGRKPFLADDPLAVVRKHLNQPPPRARRRRARLRFGDLEAVVARALAKDAGAAVRDRADDVRARSTHALAKPGARQLGHACRARSQSRAAAARRRSRPMSGWNVPAADSGRRIGPRAAASDHRGADPESGAVTATVPFGDRSVPDPAAAADCRRRCRSPRPLPVPLPHPVAASGAPLRSRCRCVARGPSAASARSRSTLPLTRNSSRSPAARSLSSIDPGDRARIAGGAARSSHRRHARTPRPARSTPSAARAVDPVAPAIIAGERSVRERRSRAALDVVAKARAREHPDNAPARVPRRENLLRQAVVDRRHQELSRRDPARSRLPHRSRADRRSCSAASSRRPRPNAQLESFSATISGRPRSRCSRKPRGHPNAIIRARVTAELHRSRSQIAEITAILAASSSRIPQLRHGIVTGRSHAQNPSFHRNPDMNTNFFRWRSARNSARQFERFSAAHSAYPQPRSTSENPSRNRSGFTPQSTLNPQLVHVDIFRGTTLDVGHAPGRGPKYSALFLAQF